MIITNGLGDARVRLLRRAQQYLCIHPVWNGRGRDIENAHERTLLHVRCDGVAKWTAYAVQTGQGSIPGFKTMGDEQVLNVMVVFGTPEIYAETSRSHGQPRHHGNAHGRRRGRWR